MVKTEIKELREEISNVLNNVNNLRRYLGEKVPHSESFKKGIMRIELNSEIKNLAELKKEIKRKQTGAYRLTHHIEFLKKLLTSEFI